MKIMCEADFNKAFNVRLADKCCANCKHGENEYEGEATCSHPKRNDGGNDYKCQDRNTAQCYVCNGWEAKEEERRMSCNHNDTKMREALENITLHFCKNCPNNGPDGCELSEAEGYFEFLCHKLKQARAALSAPARNCDVGTSAK